MKLYYFTLRIFAFTLFTLIYNYSIENYYVEKDIMLLSITLCVLRFFMNK